MNNLNFKFYSVVKNEDAMPYYDDNILVVADGLGGSGSTVHVIDRELHSGIRYELLASAFKDAVADELKPYLDELIRDMVDEKDDTSALWASRIVIARCVYALTQGEFKGADLEDKETRKKLTDFISEGLNSTAKTFDLQKGRFENQRVLPTTLVFIRYKVNDEDTVTAEAVWAGDSRCYALTADGLKQLSFDDEDSSGAITNLFSADNDKTYLHYKRHVLPKRCVLMTVSDGLFDPFDSPDNLGVEATLLTHIQNCNDVEQLSKELEDFYTAVNADDTTVAFVALGFDSYQDLKSALKERTEKILTINRKKSELRDALQVVNQSEEEAPET